MKRTNEKKDEWIETWKRNKKTDNHAPYVVILAMMAGLCFA